MIISSRYGVALRWAEEIHRPQRRKGKPIPYISHLISVSALVWEDGGNEVAMRRSTQLAATW